MAIILVRNRFSNEGMKGLVDRRGDNNRGCYSKRIQTDWG